ncbi:MULTISPECIES: DUF6644 family protein [Natronospira]|uniref:DUF2214 domain-containing protein n=1 Tax=Natronospira bacteriovora TaxID=3069753 RepID=A0ABU0W8E8_9GAMM|nr:DUF6644 family protein [Natronospira sp. AB-CW4]MDQ2070314.1 DUF2214 domain-containing protein [Natronospira sp. AB-CW4]
MLTALLLWLGETAMASALRQSTIAYPLASSAHITGLGLLVGGIITLDLRILGAIRRGRLSELAPLLSRVAAGGLLLAVTTGVLLFSVQPSHYLDNSAFLIKLGLVALAVLNALVVHQLPQWKAMLAGAPVARTLKITAVLSLLLWLSALIAGRWIAFL